MIRWGAAHLRASEREREREKEKERERELSDQGEQLRSPGFAASGHSTASEYSSRSSIAPVGAAAPVLGLTCSMQWHLRVAAAAQASSSSWETRRVNCSHS